MATKGNTPRKSVFLSYAHEDRRWVEELEKFLAPWIRDKRVNLWSDARIKVGALWKDEIERALDEATVAVLLVTSDFLGSDFIVNDELPVLLARAAQNELRLIWVAVEHSSVKATPLWQFQAANDPERPLKSLPAPRRHQAMVRIAEQIADSLTIGTFAQSLHIVDRTSEPIAAAGEHRPEEPGRQFGIQAVYEPRRDRIAFTGTVTTITAADLDKLPNEDREFIADLEDSLRRNYQRWKTVHDNLGNAGGALDGEVERELTRIARLICGDLNDILEFLRKMHKYELEDHYGRYRYICDKLSG
jgi:TIR domain